VKTKQVVTTKTLYVSSVMPIIETEDSSLAPIIAWADEHPKAWKIVTTNKSKAWGANSSTYIGWAQGVSSADAVLERLHKFHHTLHDGVNDFFTWKAQFTLDHWGLAGFDGGLFYQWDGEYNRGCSVIDYTPGSLKLVVERFIAWCDAGYKFPTKEVRIGEKVVWRGGKLVK
jgi:hypothetical protein